MLRVGKISVSVLACLGNLEILGYTVGSFPVPHKRGLLTRNGSGSNTRLRCPIKGFSGEEHQFWGLVKVLWRCPFCQCCVWHQDVVWIWLFAIGARAAGEGSLLPVSNSDLC